jgi:hypothetical protein
MTDNDQMPFGKYAGIKMANVPASYLMWLWDNHIVSVQERNRVYWYIHDNIEVIRGEFRRERKAAPAFNNLA